MLGCSWVLKFWASPQLSSSGQSHLSAQPRTECSHNHVGQRPGGRSEERRSGFSTSQTSCAGLGDGSLGRHSRPGCKCRQRCAALWPGSARSSGRGAAPPTRQPPSCSRCYGWTGARSLRGTTHDGTKIDLLAVAPKTVGFWVDEASLMWSDSSAHWNTSKGPLFLEAIRPLLVAGKLEGCHCGTATCWSSWFHVAFGHRIGLRGFGDGKTTDVSFTTTAQAQCHRCYECPALQTEPDMHVSQEVRQAARSLEPQYREQFAHGIFPSPATILPTGSLQNSCPVLWHRRPPEGILEGQIFTKGSSSGSGALGRAGWAVVAVAACGAVPCDVLPGQTASLPCTRSRCTSTVQASSRRSTGQGAKLWVQGAPEHTSGEGFWFPTKRSGLSRQRATLRDVEAVRTSHLFKRRGDHADIFAKKGADTHKPAFRVAKTVVICGASLAKQAARWAAEAHVLLRFRSWDDTRAAATRPRARPPRARLKRKRKEIAAPATG